MDKREEDERKRKTMLLRALNDPRPAVFYAAFKYESKTVAHQDYSFRLEDALREEPQSKRLLNAKRRWDAGEYKDDWKKNANRKADREEKKRGKRRKIEGISGETDSLTGNRGESQVDDEAFEIDFDSITRELQKEPSNEWIVGTINITKKFRQYQEEVLQKAKTDGLTWHNTYEILALSSIMVLCWPCPYQNFSNEEWREITRTNPSAADSVLPSSVSEPLQKTIRKHMTGQGSYMHPDDSALSEAVAKSFNALRDTVPPLAPSKTSEEEHCYKFLIHSHILCFLVFSRTMKIPLLNTEHKPRGCTLLLRKKDVAKVHLRGRKSINEQLSTKGGPGEAYLLTNFGEVVESFYMDLKFDGLYRSWPFLTSKLVIDQPTIPLFEYTFAHFWQLEDRVNKLAGNYKSRSNKFTPPTQMKFVRELPNSPQIKQLLN
ncbi:1595_t:CDS:2 [Ambispora gerdemannii]|uniref:1595_t:CDS:1 n=1 Tax=Ambispora gerdemannii TaxID=144530 RepID=A0A9N9DGU0_9GLOM|nr:1595_t:CDS:2 [Ambispora gerdemannii]